MSAIVIVRTAMTSDGAWGAFLDIAQRPGIVIDEIGESTGVHRVLFVGGDVAPGAGFETLARLLEEHTPGSSEGLERIDFG